MRNPLNGSPRISYGFGWRTHPTTGKRNFHEGVDYAVGNGTNCYASMPGTVQSSGYNSAAGNYIIIQVNSTTRIRYNHLQTRLVSTGQKVAEGHLIARSNNTGDSSGPHLHFAVYRLSGGKWVAIEPTAWLKGGQPAGSGSTPEPGRRSSGTRRSRGPPRESRPSRTGRSRTSTTASRGSRGCSP